VDELELRVFGSEPPCSRCRSALEVAENVASRHPGVEVLHVNALSDEAQRYGFWMTPAIAVGDELAFEGKVPTERELEKVVVDMLDQS
jgi:hypothetical protein